MIKIFITCLGLLCLTACASILSKSIYPIRITSNPSDARVNIVDQDGTEVYNGKAPAVVQLEASAGFFKKQQYALTFSADGYQSKTIPLLCKVDGWYWGNLLLGGVVGMLIIDPATGAMYKFHQESISTTLEKEDSAMLIIRSINELSELQKTRLELISKLSKL